MRRALLFRSWRVAAYAAVAALVVAFTLCARGAPWRGEWAWTFDWVTGSSIILGPLYAGMAAYEAADGRPFDAGVARPTARRRTVATLAPLGGPTLMVLGSYLLGAGVATAIAAGTGPTDDVDPAMVVLGTLLLLVFGLSGAAVGQYLPRTAAGLAAWLGGLAVTVGSAAIGIPHLFRIGASTGSLAGLGLWWPGVGAYALAYLVVLALVVLVAAQCWRTRTQRVRLWVLAAAALLALALVARDDHLYEPLSQPRWTCSTPAAGAVTPVRACLLAGNATQLRAWHDGLVELTATLTSTGATPVMTYRQPVPGAAVAPGEAVLLPDPQQVNIAAPTLGQLAEAVARPADCPQFHADPPPIAALAAHHWLAEYLAQRSHPALASDRDPEVLRWMTATAPVDQRAWARMAYAQLRSCSLGGLDRPADG